MINPLLHYVIVKQEKLEEVDKTYLRAKAAGILIAEHEDNKRAQAGVDKGVVVSLGPTAYRDYNVDPPIKPGDFVAFAKYSGKVITDPDDELDYVLLNDQYIVCVITRKE